MCNDLDLGAGQIDFVYYRNDLQAVLDRQVDVCHRLGLNTLRRVDHQDGALARGEAPRNLVGKVHVPRRVDEV